MSEVTRRPATRWVVLSFLSAAIACVVSGLIFAVRNPGAVSLALAQAPRSDADNAFRPRKVVGKFKPITEFPTVAVGDVGDRLNPSELVLGVTVGKKSRAYPINMLTGPIREILNDTLDGHAIAATW